MKKHWYSFTYLGNSPDTNCRMYATAVCGYEKKDFITLLEINRNKYESGLDDKAVLLSVSYLGKMTKEEMMTEVENKGERNG